MIRRFLTSGALRRAARDERGVTALEFALIAPIFLSILLATLQVFVVYLAKTQLQLATEYAARLVLTNQTATANYNTEALFKTALCSQVAIILQCQSGVYVSLQPATITSVPTAAPSLTYSASGGVSNTFPYNPGDAGNVMVLQTLYQLPVIAGPLFSFATQANGTLLLTSTVVFINEPH